jgi:hypothetical protein
MCCNGRVHQKVPGPRCQTSCDAEPQRHANRRLGTTFIFDIRRSHSKCQLNEYPKDRSNRQNHHPVTTQKVEFNGSITLLSPTLSRRPSPKQLQSVSGLFSNASRARFDNLCSAKEFDSSSITSPLLDPRILERRVMAAKAGDRSAR